MSTSAKTGPRATDVIWENVKTILYALLLAMLIRFTMVQPFRIPSGSMQPTLLVGDYIIVSKWSYGYSRFSFAPLRFGPEGRVFASKPKRGDVIVFRPEYEPGRDYVKRLVGLPGDRIQMRDGILHINDEKVQMQHLGKTPFREKGGYVQDVDTYLETLTNGVSYKVFDRDVMGPYDNTPVYEVPAGHYFMMGDDRDNSSDSRAEVQFVPFDHFVGKAEFVFVSFNHSTNLVKPWTLFTGFRPSRFLRGVE